MFELIKIVGNTYYIKNRTNIGVYKINDEEVILIDSGNDKDCAKKIKKVLDENNLRVKYIYNTHSHADHTGGNSYLQKHYNCEIFNPYPENIFTNTPVLEPTFLYGANPPNELKKKFLMADVSESQVFSENKFVKSINLPGHTISMYGFITKDNVAFLGDALISEEVLTKYPISYLFDILKHKNTLNNLKSLKADYYCLSHALLSNDISDLINKNNDVIETIESDIINICTLGITFENLMKSLFDKYNMTFTFEQSFIVGTTIRAYITYLMESNRLTFYARDNLLYYISVK